MLSRKILNAVPVAGGGGDPFNSYIYYTMENISGSTVTDEQGNSNGTLSGAVSQSTEQAKFGSNSVKNTSIFNQSLNTNHSFDQVDQAISFWFYRTSAGADDRIVGNLSGGTNVIALRAVSTTGTVQLWNGGSWANTGLSIGRNSWKHIVLNMNAVAGNVVVSVDDVQSSPLTVSSSNFKIPELSLFAELNNSFGASALGYADHFRLFQRTLTDQEVTDLYNE